MKKNIKEFKTDEEYYGDKEFLTNSMLKDFMFCNYRYYQTHVTEEFKRGDELYFIIGRALDVLITEGEEAFKGKFQIVKRKMKGMENVLNHADYELVKAMQRELLRQPLMDGMEDMKSQEVIALSIRGVKRKGKLDFLDVKRKRIVDLKTCADIKKFDPRFYTTQLTYYRQLVRAKYGIDCTCHIAAVDKQSGKYRFEFYTLDPSLLDAEEVRINNAIKDYKKSVKKDIWEGKGRHICFSCPFYTDCKLSKQTDPIIIYQ